MSGAPDLVEPLLGFRSWDLQPDGSLTSVALSYVWPGGVVTAECAQGRKHRQRQPPVASCDRGIYAYAALRPELRRRVIVGAVAVWGEVLAHEFGEEVAGFRAQYARLLALAPGLAARSADRARIDAAGERYSVPVVELAELEPEGGRHARPFGRLPAREQTKPRKRGGKRQKRTLWENPHTGELFILPASARYDLPLGIAYLPDAHLWLRREVNGLYRVGATAALAGLVSASPEVRLWAEGENPAGATLATIDGRERGTVMVRLPFRYELVGTNALLEIKPRLIHSDPYGNGWIATLRACDDGRVSGQAVDAKRYREFIDRRLDPRRPAGDAFAQVFRPERRDWDVQPPAVRPARSAITAEVRRP